MILAPTEHQPLQPLELIPEVAPQFVTYLPFDKTYLRALLSLDRLHGFTDSYDILLPYAHQVSQDNWEYIDMLDQFDCTETVRVGEGGAGYRSGLYLSYLEQKPKRFKKARSLKSRPIYEEADMITLPWSEILSLDNYTSQYASARLIWEEDVEAPELLQQNYKLRVVTDAIKHWYLRREKGEPWQPRADTTIARQVTSYLEMLDTNLVDEYFYMEQAEDYCFARVYGLTTPEEGLRRFPALIGHESNRIKAVEEAIKQADRPKNEGVLVDSNDHRIVMAIAMRYGFSKDRFANPDCVTKSFPLFWEFLDAARLATTKQWYCA